MARRDYENDPDAPKPNSLVPAASVVAVDDERRTWGRGGQPQWVCWTWKRMMSQSGSASQLKHWPGA
ncbi:hypothetical protein FHX73_114638 [Kitasatospora viridis]|uniref:Uncharacterized protein n=1 Tax=Kitasatospora viridis TaxID=281105 RepID=A0A561UN08_9ACTN|nr:hypothetical protein FHX73_114638 [Kitasatospora viridis]